MCRNGGTDSGEGAVGRDVRDWGPEGGRGGESSAGTPTRGTGRGGDVRSTCRAWSPDPGTDHNTRHTPDVPSRGTPRGSEVGVL